MMTPSHYCWFGRNFKMSPPAVRKVHWASLASLEAGQVVKNTNLYLFTTDISLCFHLLPKCWVSNTLLPPQLLKQWLFLPGCPSKSIFSNASTLDSCFLLKGKVSRGQQIKTMREKGISIKKMNESRNAAVGGRNLWGKKHRAGNPLFALSSHRSEQTFVCKASKLLGKPLTHKIVCLTSVFLSGNVLISVAFRIIKHSEPSVETSSHGALYTRASLKGCFSLLGAIKANAEPLVTIVPV